MSALGDLSERLGKLAGPDRETDVAIANALTPRGDSMLFGQSLLIGAWGPTGDLADQTHYFAEAPAYTASLDASLALVEKMLPGWKYILDNELGNDAGLYPPNWPYGKSFDFLAPTMPIAVLVALFKALDAGGGG